MSILVDDYSTPTGLRVRISCIDTGTTVQMPADLFHGFVENAKAGMYDHLGREPKVPFVHWPEGEKVPIVGEG